LRKANKNERRQHILQNHIAKLYEKLMMLKMSIKFTTVAASIAVGTLAFIPQNAQAQGFSSVQINPFGLSSVPNSYSNPALVDLDNDGDFDLMSGDYNGDFYYYENTGTNTNPSFDAPQPNSFGLTGNGSYYSAPTFVDIDNDGDLDMISPEYYGDFLFYENVGTANLPSFAAPVTNPFSLDNIGATTSSHASFADLDGDGDFDMMVGDSGNSQLLYFENVGSVTVPDFGIPQVTPFSLSPSGSWINPTFVDIDGDGDFDLFVGDGSGDAVFFENIGTTLVPLFDSEIANPFSLSDIGSYTSMSFEDLDGDGDIDMMAGESDGEFFYFEGCSPSTATIFPIAVCSYTSPSGQFYTSGGTYIDVIPNTSGCDSTITINLTINPVLDQTVSSTNPVVCGSGSTTIDLGSSQSGVSYYLRDDSDDSVIDGPVVGNGSTISFNTDVISTPKTYNVYAERQTNSTGLVFGGGNVDDKKVNCGNASSVQLSGTQITLEAWVYPTQWKGAEWGGNIINKEGSGDLGYMLRCGDNGRVNFNLGNGSWNELSTSQNTLMLNTWQYVAATYDGTTMSIYVDGNLVANQNVSINFSSPEADLTVGNWSNGGGRAFIGSIDEARVWSVAKSQSELQADMNTCLSGAETGLAAYYQFEDGTFSTTVTDISPNGNDGSLQNMDVNEVWGMGATVCSSCSMEMSQTITITIGQSSAETISPTACNSYVSPSGNYTWTATGIYLDTIPNVAGCDSVITVDLTINLVDITVDNTLLPTLTANQTGATYQWVDCDNGNAPISGEMGQSFTATANGNYAVEVTFNSCTVTSACENITGVGVKETANNVVSIYPNPTNGLVNINLGSNNSTLNYSISSIEGKVVETGKTSTNNITVDLSNESKGVYFIRINTENTSTVYKLIRQ
jgi:hypothetical protein